MTPSLLRRVGEALFGPRWQVQLAREVGVNDRDMRHYAAGSRPAPEWLGPKLTALVRTRRNALNRVHEDLTDALSVDLPIAE